MAPYQVWRKKNDGNPRVETLTLFKVPNNMNNSKRGRVLKHSVINLTYPEKKPHTNCNSMTLSAPNF